MELDGILQQFYAELIKSDGQEYEPESLKVMQDALDQYLREEGCSYSILKDPEFSNSRKVLNGKAIVLQENGKGKGKRPRKADAFTENEEELLWSCGVLARNQQPYQPQLHCFPPFQSALGNPRKTGAPSNTH